MNNFLEMNFEFFKNRKQNQLRIIHWIHVNEGKITEKISGLRFEGWKNGECLDIGSETFTII